MYAIILVLAMRLVAPLGRLGGLIIGLIIAGCFSSYLHLISLAVAGSKITFADLRQSFGARFWDVVSVLFFGSNFSIVQLVPPEKRHRTDTGTKIKSDATLIRMVLVPSTMSLLGDANWWFPKWLSFLPRIDIEGDAKEAPTVVPPPAPREPVASGV